MRSKHWKSMVLKVQHLSNDLDDKLDLLNEYKSEFEREVLKALGDTDSTPEETPEKKVESHQDSEGIVRFDEEFCRQSEILNESRKSKQEDLESTIPDFNPDDNIGHPAYVKKLWKAIALKTHPDISGSNEWVNEYNKAAQAYAQSEYEILFEVSLDVGVRLPEPDEEISAAIQEREVVLTDKIKNIQKLSLWGWINADEKRKEEIIKLTAMNLKKSRKNG
jgi:hypothetical protein